MKRHERAAAKLAAIPGVIGVFQGMRRKGGLLMTEPVLSVHVEKKVAPSELAKDQLIPATIEGLSVDVVGVGKPRLHAIDTSNEITTGFEAKPRTSTISAIAPNPDGGSWVLGSGHGLLPISAGGGGFNSGIWGSRAGMGVSVTKHPAVTGTLWFGSIGLVEDFAVVRFPELSGPDVSFGHTFAGLPIPFRSDPMQQGDIVHHEATMRGFTISGTVSKPVSRQAVPFESVAGGLTQYLDVIAVASNSAHVFSKDGESGSLVFDAQNRAIGVVVGGTATSSYVLCDFDALRNGLHSVFTAFFQGSPS